MYDYKIIDLKCFQDERGSLTPFELNNNCPFDIKRIFYICNVPNKASRGEHINSESKFLLVAIKGSVSIDIPKDGKTETFVLNSPNKALFLNNGIYKKLYNFSSDAILLCLSDNYYYQEDYV